MSSSLSPCYHKNILLVVIIKLFSYLIPLRYNLILNKYKSLVFISKLKEVGNIEVDKVFQTLSLLCIMEMNVEIKSKVRELSRRNEETMKRCSDSHNRKRCKISDFGKAVLFVMLKE